jgi:RHS repeat-associated protein
VDDDYFYDANGNLINDKNKGITTIAYNHLNLPDKVIKSTGDYLIYTYDATGRKLVQDVYSSANVLKKRSDYRGEWFYENDTLKFLNHEEGRAVAVGDWVAAPQMLPYPDMSATTSYGGIGTNVALSNEVIDSETYLKVNNTVGQRFPGFISWFIPVVPGRKYTFRFKGYNASASPAVLYVQGSGTIAGDILYPGPVIPTGAGSEGWIETTVTVPLNMYYIRVGALFQNTVPVGATMYVNRMELYEYNPRHGNAVFSQTGYEYQYHLKDHLGNVRMTFTTKDEVDSVTATVENETKDEDRSNFLRYDFSKRVKSFLFDHSKDRKTDNIGYAVRLNGSENERIGLAKSLSVMPGDTVRALVFAKYVDSSGSNWKSALTTLMGYMARPSTAPVNTIVDGTGYAMSGATSLGLTPISHSNEVEGDIPKAYLNYIFINKNFELSSVDSWSVRISDKGLEDGSDRAHDSLTFEKVVKQSGYVYVYLSNDGESVREVYFDDFKVEHLKSAVVELQDYYPFGLVFNQNKRENSFSNKLRFQGQEHIDDLGLNWDSFKWRNHQPDIGRFFNIDPLADKYVNNSPYAFSENRVMNGRELEGLEWLPVNNEGQQQPVGSENTSSYVWLGFNEDGSSHEGTVPNAFLWTGNDNTSAVYFSVDYNTDGPKIESAQITHQGTLDKIATLDEEMQKPAKELVLRSKLELNTNIIVTQGLRTNDEQNSLYAKGRSQTQLDAVGLNDVVAQPNEGIVTNAKGGESLHNYGAAFDVVPLQAGSNIPNWNSTKWTQIGGVGVKIGLNWGGNWTTFKDKPHFDNGQTVQQLQQQN